MKQMELFAGIGGFGLAGEWVGIESAVQVEWNPFCQKILAKNFPNAERYGDIKKFDGTPFRGQIDIISGGFPCQPYSTAGKRRGKEDSRHLWPEMLRVIREVGPRYVVGENVFGIVNWNGGMVFNEVQVDLENEGYEVWPVILPACGVNAPHRRDRVWFVAHSNSIRYDTNKGAANNIQEQPDSKQQRRRGWGKDYGLNDERIATNAKQQPGNQGNNEWPEREPRYGEEIRTFNCASGKDAANTNKERRQQLVIPGQPGWPGFDCGGHYAQCDSFAGFPTQSPVCGRNDGVSNRVDRIAALGNAIVPQVAFQIFKAIIECEALQNG